jgi:predicted RNA binding protein YcfA (HicA-like mRNA interferase family)
VKLPLLTGRQVLRALERLGFVEKHRKGSHVKMAHPDGRKVVFPFHDELDRATLRGALRDADVDPRNSSTASVEADGRPHRRLLHADIPDARESARFIPAVTPTSSRAGVTGGR